MSCCVEQTDGAPGSGGTNVAAADLTMRRLLPILGVAASTQIPTANNGAVSFIAPTGGGTLLDATPRQQWLSAVAVGSTASWRSGVENWTREAPFGGIDLRWIFNLGTTVAGHRAFVGLRLLATVIPAVDPSSLLSIVGVGYDLGDAQWSLMHADAAGPATVTPLGVAFGVTTTEQLSCRIVAAAGGTFELTLDNLTTGATTGALSIAVNIPAIGDVLAGHAWVNTGSDATTAASMQLAAIEDRSRPLF